MTGLRSQAFAVLGIPLLIVLLGIVGIGLLQQESDFAGRLADHSDARLFTSEMLLLRLLDAETGVRGYVATRDAVFLEPYINARRVVPGLAERVRGVGKPMPQAVRALSAGIATAAVRQLDLINSIYDDAVAGREYPAAAALLRGKTGMDAIRREIDRIQLAERNVNFERHTRIANDQRNLMFAIMGTFAVAITGGIITITLFTNRVALRLAQVVRNTEQLRDGRGPGRPLTGGDEIAAVDGALHLMASTVAARTADVIRSNADLDERNSDLKNANKELERFSYSVSHDLRAPVRAIDSFSRRLDQHHAAGLDVEGRRLLGIIGSEAQRMGRLIDDLLEFSRLGRQHLKNAPVNMNALVREVADHISTSTESHTKIVIDELPDASGDRTLLRQVWENLLANAVKYSSTRAAPAVRIGGSSDGSMATYTIADNGVGFDMKYVARLFTVFERLHRADEFPGTGVGLAIVKRIVERHGGAVSVRAVLDGGATFSFTVPLKEAHA